MASNRSETVEFDATIFNIETIKRALYRYVDVMSPSLVVDGTRIICRLNFLSNVSEDKANSLINDFKIEVLDQDLRHSIASETAPIRNAILALAFSNPNLKRDEQVQDN